MDKLNKTILAELNAKEMRTINGGSFIGKCIKALVQPFINKFNDAMDRALGRGRYAR